MSKTNELNTNNFFASDLYSHWIKIVKNAKDSVLVFTPYLDNTLTKLLLKSSEDVGKVVITSLDGENLFQRGYQLQALKDIISNGVEVKHLSGLHAKILVVDNKFISLGSQNFTSRGRKNLEAGFISKASFSETKFLETLDLWQNNAKSVTTDLIDALIAHVDEGEEELSKLKKNFVKKIESIIDENTFGDIEKIVSSENYNSTIKLAQGKAILTKTLVHSDYTGYYYSFLAEESNNLCQWVTKRSKGSNQIKELKDHDFYPAINVDTMQMKFVKLHPGRITFIRENFTQGIWDGFELNNEPFSIYFELPRTNTKQSNVKITLESFGHEKATLYFRFNTVDWRLVDKKFSSNKCAETVNKYLLSKPRKLNNFLRDQVEQLSYNPRDSQKQEIEKFLPKDRYELGIMDYKGNPILIFKDYKF